jgi:hypothetical protein
MATVTSADGTQIGYDAVGDGHPLVLVAGATSTAWSTRPRRSSGSCSPSASG